MGIVRIENVAQAAMSGALPAGLVGALGAFAGSLLAKSTEESDNLTGLTIFMGALLGALTGATIGKALGADTWLLESLAQVENEGIMLFLHYHIDLFGGPHVMVGAMLGILTFGALDVFWGSDSSFTGLFIAALLTPVVAVIAALIGQIDWGTANVIVVAMVATLYILMKSGGGTPLATDGGGGASTGKGKTKA